VVIFNKYPVYNFSFKPGAEALRAMFGGTEERIPEWLQEVGRE
jgi:hypothetical protein